MESDCRSHHLLVANFLWSNMLPGLMLPGLRQLIRVVLAEKLKMVILFLHQVLATVASEKGRRLDSAADAPL